MNGNFIQSYCQYYLALDMEDFKQQFEIIYKKFYDWGVANGFKPSKLAFSRFIGVSQGAIQNWEYKGTYPGAKDLKTIHDKLGFSYDWLITGEGEPMDKQQKQIEALKQEVEQLRTRLFVEGTTDKATVTDTAKAGGQG